jgi:cytochrome c oxidase assembly protein subunit 11
MAKNQAKIWQPLLLFITSIVAVIAIVNYPDITVNNRFVAYAILFFTVIFCLLYLYMTKQKLIRNLMLAIVGMAGFSFLLVPLYNVFCEVTGLNGKVDLSVQAATPQGVDYSRSVTVEFVVNHNDEMPWEFKAKNHTLVVHPGELAATAYYAKNTTGHTMIAQAIPSISPARVRKYFKKVECFCFSSQKLGPGQSAHLGLRFYLAPDFPKDVQRLTLAYTIFDVTNTKQKQENAHG